MAIELVYERAWMVQEQPDFIYAMHVGDLIIKIVWWMGVQMARRLLGLQMKWITLMDTLVVHPIL